MQAIINPLLLALTTGHEIIANKQETKDLGQPNHQSKHQK
jgi:hypothetical protein